MNKEAIQQSRSDDIFELMKRVRGEYEEMPGMCLTLPQARRILGLDQQICADILNSLIDRGFLRRTRDGRYIRSRS